MPNFNFAEAFMLDNKEAILIYIILYKSDLELFSFWSSGSTGQGRKIENVN